MRKEAKPRRAVEKTLVPGNNAVSRPRGKVPLSARLQATCPAISRAKVFAKESCAWEVSALTVVITHGRGGDNRGRGGRGGRAGRRTRRFARPQSGKDWRRQPGRKQHTGGSSKQNARRRPLPDTHVQTQRAIVPVDVLYSSRLSRDRRPPACLFLKLAHGSVFLFLPLPQPDHMMALRSLLLVLALVASAGVAQAQPPSVCNPVKITDTQTCSAFQSSICSTVTSPSCMSNL